MLLLVIGACDEALLQLPKELADPLAQQKALREELQLLDLEALEKRLGKNEERLKKGAGDRAAMLRDVEQMKRIQAVVEKGGDLHELNDPDATRLLHELKLFSDKPMVTVFNVGEAALGDKARVAKLHAAVPKSAVLSAPIEREIAQLEGADRAAFLAEYNLTEPAAPLLTRLAYEALDLISFFTMGEDEVRAWPIPRGSNAVAAAGKIHSDLARGFIRAEVIPWKQVEAATDMKSLKAAEPRRSDGQGVRRPGRRHPEHPLQRVRPVVAEPIRKVAILSTGEELVRGAIADTNAPYMARELRRLGANVVEVRQVGDGREAIARAAAELAPRCDLLLVSGGIGPTADDRTREALADAAGVALREDAAALAQVEAYFQRIGRTPSASNRQQALLPAGATVVPNPVGSAPGFMFTMGTIGATVVVVLPGVPSEMRAMVAASVVPLVRARNGELAGESRLLQVVGLAESVVGERIDAWMRRSEPPLVSVTVAAGCVTICASDSADAAGRARLDECVANDARARCATTSSRRGTSRSRPTSSTACGRAGRRWRSPNRAPAGWSRRR